MKRFLIFFLALLIPSCVYGADINDWIKGDGTDAIEGTDNISDLDTLTTNYLQDPLDRLLTHHIWGCVVSVTGTDEVTVSAGEVVCSNSAGTIRRFRKNTSTATVDFTAAGVGGVDSGSARDTAWFDIYAVADADATTFTLIAGKQGTALSDVTYYRYIGSVYNDAGDDIDVIWYAGEGSTLIAMHDVPVNVTTTVSNGGAGGGWSDASCSAGIPSHSTCGIFGLHATDNAAYCGLWVRPDDEAGIGGVWATDGANGVYLEAPVSTNSQIGGSVISMTDSSQNINYYSETGDSASQIDVHGFYLNR
jgi:hypothetical protein